MHYLSITHPLISKPYCFLDTGQTYIRVSLNEAVMNAIGKQ